MIKKDLFIKKILLTILPFFAFISLGLPDGLLGVAWPGIRNEFNLDIDALGVILICVTSGYMISSFFNGIIMEYLGVGEILSFSCATNAISLFVFSQTQSWLIFVIFSIFIGLGAGSIDSAMNTYIDKYHSTRMMQWLHASFGIGITSGPIIMTLALSISYRWQMGYFFVSFTIAIFSIIFFFTKNLWNDISTNEKNTILNGNKISLIETIKNIPVILSMVIFFLYTGVELGLGHWIYSILTESRNISPKTSGYVASSYWGLFTISRIIAGLASKEINNKKLILTCIVSALIGLLLIITNSGDIITILGISLAGFAVAPIFPGMISNTLSIVGEKHHMNAIGLQMSSAGFGMALIPSLGGIFAKKFGLEIIPIYLFLILIFMLFFFSYINFKFRK